MPSDGKAQRNRGGLLRSFHLIAVTEAVTYLALVGASIAHRGFGTANLVPAVGLIHGTVFLVYLSLAFVLRRRFGWDALTIILIVLAAVVPFGTLLVERRIAQSPYAPDILGARSEPSPSRSYSSAAEPKYDIEIQDGPTLWRFEGDFLNSNWNCIWGRGCQGILDHPAEELNQGCCSVGAEMVDDEAASTQANLAYLDPQIFQFHEAALQDGIFADAAKTNTRIVDGACIFLNRPGFAGGAGCALHLAALRDGESPLDWKPSVCWQLPIRVDWAAGEGDTETASLRAWRRRDWGEDGATMAWWCTEANEAFDSRVRVIDSLAEELEEVVGTEVFIHLRNALDSEGRTG